MTTLTTTWEIEVEQAHHDFDETHDEVEFRERLERLGLHDDEIADHLRAVKGPLL